ncbi:MAG: WD40 repeat domain-containing protein [Planctomycetes bacterium]|nr:WD40 repeat domain-containing protein [Planctomycetota bacterium]
MRATPVRRLIATTFLLLLATTASLSIRPARAAEPLVKLSADLVIELAASSEVTSPPVVTAVAIHPRGDVLAAAGDDHLVRILDVKTGRLLRTLSGHSDWVRSVAFSPDGETLSTAGDDGRVILWTLKTGQQIDLGYAGQSVFAVCFSADGRLLASVGFARKLRIYDLQKQREVAAWSCACRDTRTVAFSEDGKRIVAGGRNGKLRAWDVASGEIVWQESSHRRRIRQIVTSPDGKLMASIGDGSQLRVWRVEDGRLQREIKTPGPKMLSLEFLDKQRLAAGGSDNVVHLWDTASGRRLARLEGHTGSVAAMAYDRSTKLLVTGSYDTTIRLWKLDNLNEKLRGQRQATRPTTRSK